jgi:hypothetical protein
MPALSRIAKPVLFATETYLTSPVFVSTWQTNKPEPSGLRPSGSAGHGIRGLKIMARFCSALAAGCREKAKINTIAVSRSVYRVSILPQSAASFSGSGTVWMMEKATPEVISVKTDHHDNPPKKIADDGKTYHFHECPGKRHCIASAKRKV